MTGKGNSANKSAVISPSLLCPSPSLPPPPSQPHRRSVDWEAMPKSQLESEIIEEGKSGAA